MDERIAAVAREAEYSFSADAVQDVVTVHRHRRRAGHRTTPDLRKGIEDCRDTGQGDAKYRPAGIGAAALGDTVA